MATYAISTEQSRRMDAALGDLLFEAEARAVILSDIGGNVIAGTRSVDGYQGDTLTALAAGSYAATRELARQVSEPDFQSVYHQGERTSIYIQGLSAAFMLTVIFDNSRTTVGLVKLYAGKLARQLTPELDALMGQGVSVADCRARFEMDGGADVFERVRQV
jgi:predicted regulator of Ras-like GTPase activity (Roadblock/LC7/MglB family)